MRRRYLTIAALMLLHGCAYHRLVVAEPVSGDSSYHKVDSSAAGWGAIEQQSVADKCVTNLLSEVRVKTSLADSLATVLTLGLWQPARIEYRCAKLPTPVGEIKP
jgi:Bor protein